MLIHLVILVATSHAEEPFTRGCNLQDQKMVKDYNDGLAALDRADARAALRLLDRVLDRQPDCEGALLLAGQAAFRLGDPRSLEFLRHGMDLYPDTLAFPKVVADVTFSAQAFEDSLRVAEALRARAPGDADAVVLEHRALLRLGRYTDAHARLDAATGVPAPLAACLRVAIFGDQHQFAEADAQMPACRQHDVPELVKQTEANLDIARGATPDGDAPDVVGYRHLANGDYAAAAAAFEALAAAEPWNAIYQINLVIAYAGLNQYGRAEPLLDKLLAAQEWVTVYQDGGMTGITTKRSEADLNTALQNAVSHLVRVLANNGRLERAATALRKAEARFGRTAPLLAAEVTLAMEKQDLPGAWTTARAALSSFPDDLAVQDAVSTLAFTDPARVDAQVLQLAARTPHAHVRANILSGLHNAGRHAELLATARPLVATLQGPDQDHTRAAAYTSALHLQDLAAADELLVPTLDATLRDHHAGLRWAQEHEREAEALATEVEAESRGDTQALASVGVLALAAADAGHPADALRWAADPRMPALYRYTLAIDFANRRDMGSAAKVLAGFDCATVPEVDAADCRLVVEHVRSGR